MTSLIIHSSASLTKPFSGTREMIALLLLLGWLGLLSVKGQEITHDFNLIGETGWQRFTPTTAGSALPQYSFPADGSGGNAYRMFGPPLTCQGILQRGGAYRSEQYTEFFYSVDLVNFDPTFGAFALFGGRIGPPGTLVPLSTQGYMTGYLVGGPRQRQAVFINIEFTSEVISTVVDAYRGGGALTSVFPPSRPLRAAFSGTNDTFRSEIYDRTDLLEPLVRINFQDFLHSEADTIHAQGENLIGWLNLAPDTGLNTTCDFTFDDYHATGVRNSPIGFPGTPQVVRLKPAAQTLFYLPPANGSNITFTISTFTANQINTNELKLFLNGVDVSSQLVLTQVGGVPPLGTPNTNFFVRYTGSLSANTLYKGQIRVVDMAGKGTTNNWFFDTFTYFDPTDAFGTSGFLLVEAEDYNFDGGFFITYPPVSGTDETTTSEDPVLDPSRNDDAQETLGPEVNPGAGFYNKSGIADIDFHDNNPAGSPDPITRNQYRTSDRVGTLQGTKGGGLDTPRSYRMNLPNASAGTSYVPDYVVGDVDAGDWMNYTRTFPSANYQVYLRASSQARQDVRMDEVTGDRTQPNQTKALRGQFLVPNTESWTRWRYVPLTDAAGNLQTLSLGGERTVRLTANEAKRAITIPVDVGDLQLNWLLLVPTPAPASSGPWIASAKPSRDSANFHPDGTIEINLLDRGIAVSSGSIQLRFDGASVSPTIDPSTEGPGKMVRYHPGLLLPKSVHTIHLVFGDGSILQTNQWTFTVDDLPLIPPSHALGGAPDTAFTVQVHKAQDEEPAACEINGTLPNGDPYSVVLETFEDNIARAERQLAGQMPFANEAEGTGMYTESDAINYKDGANAGLFPGDKPFPGIPGGGNHFAMAATIKLQLAPGVYRMGVHSDDQFKVTTGPVSGTELYLGSSETDPGTRNNGQFEFVVQSSGVYRLRMVMEEEHGDANAEWYFVNRTTGNRTLVNVVEALVLESAPTVIGPWIEETGAMFDFGTKTITVAQSGNQRFYRLRGPNALTITSTSVSGGNVVITYQ